MDDVVTFGRSNRKISDLVKEKGAIMSLIKSGYDFEDDVLKEAHIKRIIRESNTELTIVDHEKDTKIYKKDTDNLKSILKSINTLSNGDELTSFNENEELTDDNEQLY